MTDENAKKPDEVVEQERSADLARSEAQERLAAELEKVRPDLPRMTQEDWDNQLEFAKDVHRRYNQIREDGRSKVTLDGSRMLDKAIVPPDEPTPCACGKASLPDYAASMFIGDSNMEHMRSKCEPGVPPTYAPLNTRHTTACVERAGAGVVKCDGECAMEDMDELPASGEVHPGDAPQPAMLPFDEEQKPETGKKMTCECGPEIHDRSPRALAECAAIRDAPEPEPGKQLQKWADVAMWSAPKHIDPQNPVVTVTWAPEDPLGIMAMINGMYTGKVYRSPSEVSDDERRQAWDDFAKSRLSEAPAEWFQLSILFENVTRAFTHQLVRTRLSTYAQESMRFAVKEDVFDAVKLPPSLSGTMSLCELVDDLHDAGLITEGMSNDDVDGVIAHNSSREQKWRNYWDIAVGAIGRAYSDMVESGMPAEDARGILPTNILTRVHDRYDIKTLRNQAGMRLCTQAQFEWRAVFGQLVSALRTFLPEDHPNAWQYELIASTFRPVCFAANRCVMKASGDRACSIRDQVDQFENLGIPSTYWEDPQQAIPYIRPEQWLADPTAARVAP